MDGLFLYGAFILGILGCGVSIVCVEELLVRIFRRYFPDHTPVFDPVEFEEWLADKHWLSEPNLSAPWWKRDPLDLGTQWRRMQREILDGTWARRQEELREARMAEHHADELLARRRACWPCLFGENSHCEAGMARRAALDDVRRNQRA